MTEAVEDCSEKHNTLCKSPEEVTQEKDKQLARVLAQVKASVKEWDSDKCPAVREHEKRMQARNNEDEISKNNEAANSFANIATLSASIAMMNIMLQFI